VHLQNYLLKHKKYQAIMTLLRGIEFISIFGDDAKKCQQAFLAPLSGMEFISIIGDDAKKRQQLCFRIL
jgi:hypothetical protein